jgi:hypothetical protein
MKRTLVVVALLSLSVCSVLGAQAKEKEERLRMKKFQTLTVKVYAAVVQVATTNQGFELTTATKEGYIVAFEERENPGSKWTEGSNWGVTAICHEDGAGSTIVTLHFKRTQSRILVGIEGAKDEMAEKFWARLEKALKFNEQLVPSKSKE